MTSTIQPTFLSNSLSFWDWTCSCPIKALGPTCPAVYPQLCPGFTFGNVAPDLLGGTWFQPTLGEMCLFKREDAQNRGWRGNSVHLDFRL